MAGAQDVTTYAEEVGGCGKSPLVGVGVAFSSVLCWVLASLLNIAASAALEEEECSAAAPVVAIGDSIAYSTLHKSREIRKMFTKCEGGNENERKEGQRGRFAKFK